MRTPLVSVSGVRGIVGDSFTEDLVRRWSSALAQFLSLRAQPRKAQSFYGAQRSNPEEITDPVPSEVRDLAPRNNVKVVLARDTRPSGTWAVALAAETLAAAGVQPVVLGIVPTPTAQLAVTHHRAAGGLVITGSHNPAEWNALKFLGPDGVFLSGKDVEVLQVIARNEVTKQSPREPYSEGIASPSPFSKSWARNDDQAIDRHITNILGLPIDLASIRARAFRVVVDPVNGAGVLAVPRLLEELGCIVTVINGDPTGDFAHLPEPTPAHLTELGRAVREAHADLGLAVDPDADRLVFVDETGQVLSEEYTVTLAVLSVLSSPVILSGAQRSEGSRTVEGRGPSAAPQDDRQRMAVVNLSTTRMVDDVAARCGARVVRTSVGERYVVEGMRAHRAIIGGEGNGGVIFVPSHEGRDSLVGAALVLDLLARRGDTLSQLCAALPRYLMQKEKLLRGDAWDHERIATALISAFPEAQLSTLDGVRVDTPDGWVHLRPSNTEPILRLIAEARTGDILTGLLARVRHVLAVPAVSTYT